MSRIAKAAAVAVSTGAMVFGGAGLALASSDAEGAAVGSPGVLSGNIIQVPLHIPVNLCGNTINLLALLNPAFGNVCINADKEEHEVENNWAAEDGKGHEDGKSYNKDSKGHEDSKSYDNGSKGHEDSKSYNKDEEKSAEDGKGHGEDKAQHSADMYPGDQGHGEDKAQHSADMYPGGQGQQGAQAEQGAWARHGG